jgi:hypothetical protein
MKDTSRLFEQYLAAYRSNCPHWTSSGCDSGHGCKCTAPAEVNAITRALLPPSCFDKNLSDFMGAVPGKDKPVLSSEVVAVAKAVLVKYCWNDLSFDGDTDFNAPAVLKRSVLTGRHANGTSLVIHGNSLRGHTTNSGSGDTFKHKLQVSNHSIGRTLLASIVMKEVVRQRSFPGHIGDTYEWISFPALKSRVTERDQDAVREYQTCDWLVVDAIHPLEKVSDNMKGYMLEKLNSVFVERSESRLPTILVFQYDIQADIDSNSLHEKVGLGLSQIVEDETTFRICLTDRGAQ